MTCRSLCIPIVLALAYHMANGGSSPFNDVESESTTPESMYQYETGSSVESNNYSTIPFSETITTEVNDGSSGGNMTDNIGDIVDRKENNGNISIEESDTTEDTSRISVKILIGQYDRLSVLDLATKKLLPPLRDEEYVQFRSIDYLYNESLIFYSANSSIMRATLDEDFRLTEDIVIVNNTVNVSLAVDWVNKELYWIEENYQRLMKSDLEGGNQKIVVQNSTAYSFNFPNNIVVDPCKGLVFFVSNHAVYKIVSNNGDIKQVEVDGNEAGVRERGVRTIALDRTNECIYISGEDLEEAVNTHYLARVSYDGSDIKEFPMKGMGDIFSMDVFDGTLYLADYESGVGEHLLSVSTTISDKLSTTKLFVPWRYYQSIYNVKIYGPRIQTCRTD
ncbi:low-density lipoprotein receptor-related protein 2-like [Macrosteles quadrilineatus]|uniref:low-density lipoprotein receptor-related protein 2-like n=1 Tax=Macrosteles quadrilineatus TaxID=74068 RepID=UPI0023E20583|nr:low-density lipoprotein receptor-related protein 2-like [Macrosteles quadrilineatus]